MRVMSYVALAAALIEGFCLPPSDVARRICLQSSVAEEPSTKQPAAASANPSHPPPPPAPDMKAFANGYKTVFEEISCSLKTPTFGEIPSDLVGTYYKSGPAMFSAGSLPPPKNSLVKPKQSP